MLIKHLLFRLSVLCTVAAMRPEGAIEYLNELLREARKLRHRQWAIRFLEAQKQQTQKRLNVAVADNHRSRST